MKEFTTINKRNRKIKDNNSERKELFARLKDALETLDIKYNAPKYFNLNDSKLRYLVSKYEDEVDNLEENSDYRMYRGL